MPIDARYLLGMAVAFTVFQFAPKAWHKLHHHKPSAAMLDVVCYGNLNIELEHFKRACPNVNLPVPDPNSRHNPLGQ